LVNEGGRRIFLRPAACTVFGFAAVAKKRLFHLWNGLWNGPQSKVKPPWMAVLGSMGMDARCFRTVRMSTHLPISLVKSAF
jgi:hypothetical protein